jgi:hypothetical protein
MTAAVARGGDSAGAAVLALALAPAAFEESSLERCGCILHLLLLVGVEQKQAAAAERTIDRSIRGRTEVSFPVVVKVGARDLVMRRVDLVLTKSSYVIVTQERPDGVT